MQELPDRDRILSVFCHQSDVSDVCSKVFGISYPDYVNWLGEQKYGAKHVPQNVLPPLLMREKSLFLYRQGRLDSLRNKRFKFKLVENKFRHDLSSNVVTLRIGDGLKILDHVNELGYQPKTLSSLSVICGENAGLKITAPLFQLRRNESPVVMEILPPPTAELLPQSGYLHLTDIGTARVMRDEDSVFREFEFYLTCRDTFGREIPTGRAWEWLEPIFGRDRPHNGRRRYR
jgi:hypothetical protein